MKILKITVLFLILLTINGCNTTPVKPFGKTTQKIRFEMIGFKEEANQILSISLKNLIPVRGHHLINENCISREDTMPTGDKKSVKFCYYVNLSNQTIQRQNVTTCRKSNYMKTQYYTARGEDCGFTFLLSGLIDNFSATDLVNEFNKNSDKFLSYYKGYVDYASQMDKEVEKLKVYLKDNTNILSTQELNQVSQFSWYRVNKFLVSASQTNVDYSDLYQVMVRCDMSNIDKRYSIISPSDHVVLSSRLADEVTFEIDSIKFNYIPFTFELGDKKLNAKINTSTYKAGKPRDSEITLINTSDNFIVITELAGYFNKNVVSGIISNYNEPISIPPQSSKTFVISNSQFESIYGSGLVPVRTRDQLINYGFSIQYESSDGSGKKDLYKLNRYSIEDLISS